jgi:thiamine biosynthesis protein ThiI
VEAKRADKKFPLKSPEIARDVGEAILNRYSHLKVDVIHPEVTVYVEVRDFAAYVHVDPVPGAGGLPVGTAGKAALMLSGGIDSPVAAQRMARRGLELEAVHFFSYPYTSERAKQKVLTLTGILTNYIGRFPIHIVPFTRIQEEIRDKCPEDFFTLIMRRSMMRIVNRIAADTGCSAIITGECLGQVASQTIQALAATEDASALPVLRPLIGMDKEDIVRIAREIGTFETSILPYEDCCTVFTPKHPKTKPRIDEIRALETAVDFETLESEAVLNCERLVITHEQDG